MKTAWVPELPRCDEMLPLSHWNHGQFTITAKVLTGPGPSVRYRAISSSLTTPLMNARKALSTSGIKDGHCAEQLIQL